MKDKLLENVKLLIKDGEAFERINMSILFSVKRNMFFNHLGNYINFYNGIRNKLEKEYSSDETKNAIIQKIPILHFEDYSLSLIFQFILMFFVPISIIIFLVQWSYIKETKSKLRNGLKELQQLL